METKNFPILVDLLKKTDYNAKITDIEDKISSISGLATITASTPVENEIPDVSNLVKITDYNTKITEIENNIQSKLDLVEKHPTAKTIFREKSVKKFYSAMNIPSNSFKFRYTKRAEIYKILINIDSKRRMVQTKYLKVFQKTERNY